MSPSVKAAIAAVRVSVNLLENAVADVEPAPVSVVLVQGDGGKVHRAARIEGIPGLMTYEADNLDWVDYKVLHDLSAVNDEMDLCRRCFGDLDEGEDA
jgi:hypothetical protein